MSTERRAAWMILTLGSLVLFALVAWVIVDRNLPPTWQSPWGELSPNSQSPMARD